MLRLIASLAFSLSAFAKEIPSLTPSLEEFRAYCRQHHQQKTVPDFPAPSAGQTLFVPTPSLVSNQGRFSWIETRKKLVEAVVDQARAYMDKNSGEWVRSHDEGRSAFPVAKAIHGIYYRSSLYIVDGHHRALISTYLGSETIPVKVLKDLSQDLEPEQLREYLAKRAYSHFKDFRGATIPAIDFCEMIDDPNLGLARKLFARVDLEFENGHLRYANLRGPSRVIGVKAGSDLPFLEFEVADALRRGGIHWEDEYSTEFSPQQMADFLEILRTASRSDPGSRLNQVLLFDQPKHMADLDLRAALTTHLRILDCESSLMTNPRP